MMMELQKSPAIEQKVQKTAVKLIQDLLQLKKLRSQ